MDALLLVGLGNALAATALAHRPAPAVDANWQHLHNEAIKVWEQLNATRPGTDRTEQVQAANDEVELLQAELEVKKAQLQVAQEAARAAEVRLGRVRALSVRGAVSEEVLGQAERDAAGAQAQVRVREAELKVDVVKLRQAERRLNALQQAAPDAGKRRQAEERLKALDQQLRKLLDEKKALEKELHRER